MQLADNRLYEKNLEWYEVITKFVPYLKGDASLMILNDISKTKQT